MKRLLLICYWLGIVVDAGATVLLFWPTAADLALHPAPFELSPIYLYVSRVAGGLMFGWTVLLFWAQLKPIERADVLLMTLFPVVATLAVAAILVVQSEQISLLNMAPLFAVYVALFAMIVPAYVWARKQRTTAL